ncbi:AMP-binding protein [Lichenicoccus sp.]|uniref:AMP-binding protein n=1 Tax=Lichenicoccus sp. TaxID=2781899 RepID=UPI003D0E5D2F
MLFAACLLAGRVSLLSGDHSARAVSRIHTDHPGSIALDDIAVAAIGPAADLSESWPPPALPLAQQAAIVLTSGSTGAPSAARKCWGELVARSQAAAERFGLVGGGSPAIVGTVPPHHMYGFETTVLLPLHGDCASWCGPTFYPADIRAALSEVRGRRILVTTPVHLRALLEQPLERPPEQVISATAPLEQALAARARDEWGALVSEIFGATEVGSIASRRTLDEAGWTLYPGIALSGTDEAPVVHAPHAAPHPLSDIIERHPDGSGFLLLGRSGDLVKIGGRRASLEGLGRTLRAIDGVIDGVFIVPDDLNQRPGARLLAFAVAPGGDARALLAALRHEIDPLFLPRRLILCDRLPRNEVGKLPREALRALLDKADD